TGIAQCAELSWQLRGEAAKRQVSNVKYALQHNIGLGGAAVVGIYKLGFPQSVPVPKSTAATSILKSVAFFEQIEAKISQEGKAMVTKIGSIIGFNVACSDKIVSYVIDLKNGTGSVKMNDGSIKPDCTISIADDDLAKILEGKLNMMSAFTQKKLKISGNMSVAMKLNQLFASVAKKVEAKPLVPKETDAAKPVSQPLSSELAKTTIKHKSGQFFDEVEAKMKQEGPGYVSKVNAVIGFTITECPNNETFSYILNLKKAPGSISVNDGSTKADVTITLKDNDMLEILGGKLNMMSAFTKKKLKISGNMSVAMKLNQIFSSVLKTRSKL
ncbi:non-specific lipid-transfer, partial [Brachionus plicatilis]